MRFDSSMMTPEQIAAANAKYMQSIYGSPGMAPSAVTKKPDKDPYAGTGLEGTAGIKGQQVSYISDLGYEPEFVPPQDSTGALGINPDTDDTFLPNEPPPQLQTGNDFDTRPQVYGNPYGIQGGPQMGAGKGGYRPPMYGGGFGGPQYGNPYGGGFGRPQYGNPYGGGFGRPPMGGGKGGGRPPMYGNPYGGGFGGGFGRPPMGGGFGGRMAAPGFNTATGTFDGGQPVSGIADAGEPIMNPGGIGSFSGANQPTNPYSTGYGMGYQQQPNQQPNQQPMGGGKGGTQSGGGKGGAQ